MSEALILTVWELLEGRAVNGQVCFPVRELAQATGTSERNIGRILRLLCASGDLTATGRRRDRTAIFLLRSQTPRGSEAEAAPGSAEGSLQTPTGSWRSSPRSDEATAGQRTDTPTPPDGGSGAAAATAQVDAPDPNPPVAEPVNTEEGRKVGMAAMETWLAVHGHYDDIGEPDLGAGRCGECGQPAPCRWTLGSYELCRHCRRIRQAALVEEPGPTHTRQEQDWATNVPAPSSTTNLIPDLTEALHLSIPVSPEPEPEDDPEDWPLPDY